MTTTTSGGRIGGRIGLTCATDVALAVGDFVQLVGDYKVGLADGSKASIGQVAVRSVKRVSSPTSTSYPVATTTGGEVTIESRGYYVDVVTSAGIWAAGDEIGLNASGLPVILSAAVNARSRVGVALMASAGAGAKCDVLFN